MPMIPKGVKKPKKMKKGKGYKHGGVTLGKKKEMKGGSYEAGGSTGMPSSNARKKMPYSTKGKAPTPGQYKGSMMYTKHDRGRSNK